MAENQNQLAVQEFRDDFRLAVHQLMQFVENELGAGQHRVRPDDRQWRLQRSKTIEKLDELIRKLDKTCVAANYGKGVGIGTEIAGEITTIIAALMELNESSSARTLTNLGNLLKHSGYLLEGASNVAESFISAKYLMEIEEVLQIDQELSRPLQDWLTFSQDLNANVREVFGCDLNFAIQHNVLKVFSEFTMLHRHFGDFQQTIDNMRSGNHSLDLDVNVPIETLLRFSSQLEMYPEFYDPIRTICTTIGNSARVAQVAREGIRVYRNLFGEDEINSGTNINPRISHAITDSNTSDNSNENIRMVEGSTRIRMEGHREPPNVRAVSTFCAFQTINIALNAVYLSRVIMDIKDGKSKYSHALQQISNLLAMDLRSMEAL